MIDESEDVLAELRPKSGDLNEQTITLKMIMRRNLVDAGKNTYENKKDVLQAADSKAEQLLKLTHIHLDRENIGKIDNLAEYLGPVTNLYLQHNLIKRIENLELLGKLAFLTLSNNRIARVEFEGARFVGEFDRGVRCGRAALFAHCARFEGE